MYKNTLKFTLTAGLLLLSACGQNNNSKNVVNNQVPKSLEFQKPAKGQALTKEQAQEIKKEFTVESRMTLPSFDLVFPSRNLSDFEKWELAEKEAQLKNEDKNAYDLLQELRGKCKKGHPNLNFDATFPTERDVTEDDLSIGDKANASGSFAIVGSNCPATYSMGASATSSILDKNDTSISANAGMGLNGAMVMNNQKYAQLLGARGLKLNTQLSGLGVRRDIEVGKSDRVFATFKLNGSFLSLRNEIPVSADVSALIESNLEKNESETKIKRGREEVIIDAKIQMTTFAANLVLHVISEGERVLSSEMYLNGNAITERELNELFGKGASQLSKESSSKIHLLN